jgi:photosystem II stability/assembly factor-like uncharacterized protein
VNWETSLQTIEFDPLSPETLYAGTSGFGAGEIYKTTNGGINWFSIATNDTLLDGVWTIAVHPETTSILFAGSHSLLKSMDAGMSWFTTGLWNTGVTSLAIDFSAPPLMYAGTTVSSGGLQKSFDGGISWQAANNGLPSQSSAGELLMSPRTKSPYAGVGTVGDSGGLFYSSNCGEFWKRIPGLVIGNRMHALALSPNNEVLYVGIRDYGIYRKKLIH